MKSEVGSSANLKSINGARITKIVTGLTKSQIRSKIIAKLKTQKEEDRNKKSRAIKDKLFARSVFKKARIAMFYIPFNGEVNTQDMIKEAIRLGKIVVVPVCRGDRATIRPCILQEKAELKKGPYGICEPTDKTFISPQDLDLVIVPGVAFDKKGNRLGRGKGCYDYFLRKIPKDTATVGLAFDFQILPFIPATQTDVRVRSVISN